MAVVGIGTDIVQIDRISKMKEGARDRLALRILTADEYQRYIALKYSVPFLAKRWAGKEAAAKALGKGIADGISFQHIEIQQLDSGQPQLVFTNRALEVAELLKAEQYQISLSDEKDYAIAFAVLSN